MRKKSCWGATALQCTGCATSTKCKLQFLGFTLKFVTHTAVCKKYTCNNAQKGLLVRTATAATEAESANHNFQILY